MIFTTNKKFQEEVDRHKNLKHPLKKVSDSEHFLTGFECTKCKKKFWISTMKETEPVKNLDTDDDDDDDDEEKEDEDKDEKQIIL